MMEPQNVQTEQDWPFSIPRAACSPFAFDITHYRERFDDESDRLFTSSDATRIKVILPSSENRTFKGATSFQTWMRENNLQPKGIRIILVPQLYSWGKLMVSKEATNDLLRNLEAFPPVFDVIDAFGERTGPSNESLGGAVVQTSKTGKELSFLLKHAEKHGREEPGDAWSIRQMGVYARLSDQSSATFVLFNPSLVFQQRIKDALSAPQREIVASDVLDLLASCCTSRWRSYINDIERDFHLLKSKANEAAVIYAGGGKKSMTIDFGDTQDLRVIADKLHRLEHILKTNLEVCLTLKKTSGELCLLDHQSTATDRASGLDYCVTEHGLQCARASSLIQRPGSSSELMQNILSVQGLYALRKSGQITTGIMRLAQNDNKMMLDFSRKAQSDARALKSITVLTMIYLPASFVSQVLAMGYVKVTSHGSTVGLHFDGEMVIFAVLSITLLLITGGTYGILEWRRRARQRLRLKSLPDLDLNVYPTEDKDTLP